MKAKRTDITYAFELDGLTYRLEGESLILMDSLESVAGDKWVITDFTEGMARFMSVDGPVKFAEVLVRRKLQESGEFEEPVEIIAHWKKKRGQNSTDIFFTAVPTRLVRRYFDESKAGDCHTLVFPMYGALWHVLQRMGDTQPSAVVLRHSRFAEVVIGTRHKVHFANRCVAFDTQDEQLQALWENVRADIESVQNDQHLDVTRIVCVSWVDATEAPAWPDDWLERTVYLDAPQVMVDDQYQSISWPHAAMKQSAYHSASPPSAIGLFYAQRWSPVINMAMALVFVSLLAVGIGYRIQGGGLQVQVDSVQRQIGQIRLETVTLPITQDMFDRQLKFVQDLDRSRQLPSYREVLNDLTLPEFHIMQVQSLTLDYEMDAMRVELFGNIVAPFETAHGRYKQFLHHLKTKGYRIDESRFETQINRSQVVLKLSRALA